LKLDLRPIPERILQARDTYPQNTALIDSDSHLSFEELNRRADQFASHLTHIGITMGQSVTLCMERSFDWIVAALGIMRAGAAYVPLDATWPTSRLRYAVEDAGTSVIVSRAALLDRIAAKALGIDPVRDAAKIAASPRLDPAPIDPQSLAYIIYTSGSTGLPKGVEITHTNLNHLVDWHTDAFRVTQKDRGSHLAGLGFDAAVWEIWPYLSVGATVCLADDRVRARPDLIQQWMVRERVTVGFVPTVHATAMMDMEWPRNADLRFLLTGGDTLQRGPTAWLPFEVVNNYGLTECTVVSTSSALHPGAEGVPPIGRPIADTSIYVLNEEGQQVPSGVVGEIFVGGRGVGRGYRHSPELTKQRFLKDPFASESDARMYRTGDRGSRRPDGQVDFHGRCDRQTKIRGQRVELDEISCVLAQHLDVDFATAANIAAAAGNQLVAYVLPKESERVPTSDELQKHLLRRLPEYMVPAVFFRLRAIPLSSNGKLDLSLLPGPSDAEPLERHAGREAASPIEATLLTVVRQILSNEEVAPTDSFFLAGGHSLLGMQLLIQVRNSFGVDLTLRQLFEAPTVESLAALIETKLNDFVGLERRSNGIFWVQSQARELASQLGDDQPLLCVALAEEEFDPSGELPSLPTIAARVVRQIQRTQPKGPYKIGGFCLGAILAYEVAFQLRSQGQDVPLLVLLNAPNPAFLKQRDSLRHQLTYLRYALKRASFLGLRRTLVYASEHLAKHISSIVPTHKKSIQQMTKIAAHAYQPPLYDGNVLLLLASKRPPYVDFAPGWQAVVTGELRVEYVEAHHRDLLQSEAVHRVASVISSHLPQAADVGTPAVPAVG
jgi:amino acid adenylation domain-containing protein